MKSLIFGFLTVFTLSAFGDEPELFCFEKSNPKSLILVDGNLEGGACDDAFNLLSVYADDYGICYTGSAKAARESWFKEPIEYMYFGYQYKVVAVLSPKDKKDDVIKFQIKDLDSRDKNRLVNIIGEISRCK